MPPLGVLCVHERHYHCDRRRHQQNLYGPANQPAPQPYIHFSLYAYKECDRIKKYSTGLFVGRFQPFHNGHLAALRYAASMCDCIVIGIGSSQKSGTSTNPFTYAQRIRMIRSAIRGSGTESKTRIMGIPDFGDNEKWFGYIIGKVPGIDAVFTRNVLVKSIFRSHGVEVISPRWHDRKTLRATLIRGMMAKGGRWQPRVPPGTTKEINRHRHYG